MTENQRLNVKDFIDRLIYLAGQIRACKTFSPVSLLGEPREIEVHIDKLEDFQEILDIYKIGDSALDISESDKITLRAVSFRGLRLIYSEL